MFLICGTALVLAPLREGGFVYNGLSVITLFYTLYTVYMSDIVLLSAPERLAEADGSVCLRRLVLPRP